MKKHMLALTAATALALTAGAASAQSWMSINERQMRLDSRIDAGVRNGDLTRNEAMAVRADYRALADLEARYRADGLSAWERNDLDRRFDQLSTRIRMERTDAAQRGSDGWMSINQRQARLDSRIDAGVRSGDLTRNEAMAVRADYRVLANLEARYRADGLTAWERNDLDRRFDQLSMRIRAERNDMDQRDWYGGRGWTDNRGAWVQVNRRQAQLDRRIDQGLRNGQITAREAARLRAEFNAIARVEANYRVGGFTVAERADLDRRFDRLAAQIRWERRDGERYGANRY